MQTPRDRNTLLDLKARVGRHHFALLRGYLEGIDLKVLAQRYLHADGGEAAADIRIVKRILRWTIDELIVLARRQGKFAFAHAIDIDPGRIQTADDQQTPSLEEFRSERDPDGFYSETELLELFRDEYRNAGSNRKEKRNARLRERQHEALRWLETQVAADPQLDDHLTGWFPDMLATRLNAAGLITIRELVAWINQRGLRWYAPLPKIGKEAALRIHTWLEMNQGSLGHRFGKQVFVKRSALTAEEGSQHNVVEGIVPLEYFKADPKRDGSAGSNRETTHQSVTRNDTDAINLWLSTCSQTGGATWLSYRREAERFLLYCVIELQKPLSSAGFDDCLSYRQFLHDLGRLPAEQWEARYNTHANDWLGRRGTSRSSTAWRPFDGSKQSKEKKTPPRPLSPSSQHSEFGLSESLDDSMGALGLTSQRQAIIILKNLFSWLMNNHYLSSNPFESIKPILEQRPTGKTDRSFNSSEWEMILQVLETLPKDAHYFRLRFTLLFSYSTGLSIPDMVEIKWGDFQTDQSTHREKNHSRYLLNVAGTRGKARTVTLSNELIGELSAYMAHRGFATLDSVPTDTYLIGRLQSLSSSITVALQQRNVDMHVDKLSARNLYQSIKDFFAYAQGVLQTRAPDSTPFMLKKGMRWLKQAGDSRAIASDFSAEMDEGSYATYSIG